MSIRNYNRLYVHTDREEGSEKILFGYRNDTREIVLYKDKETLLHVPFFADSVSLNNSTLINDGATGGPFPAAADRIFKNNKNHGNVTANGDPSPLADGGWFCSWLYKDELGRETWMDRYYHPGKFILTLATSQLLEGPPYRKHNPVFYDVPSTMLLESGVQYSYFHIGEKTARELVTTYQGVSGERLRLNLDNWGSVVTDSSLNQIPVKIFSTGTDKDLFDLGTESTEHVQAPTVSFNNKHETEITVDYDPLYALTNEFSLAFWAQSDNWFQTQSTQLVGNYSSKGGIGLFVDTLSSYPFFVIPETGYGHLLYVNEKFNQFLDKSVQLTVALTASPEFIALDSDNNVIVCNSDSSRLITKYDNAGEIIARTVLPSLTENIVQLLCGPNDTYVVITDRQRYTYDMHLNLLNTTLWQSLSTTVAAYAYDIKNDTAELISVDDVYDSKYIETTHWCLSAGDGNLYRKLPNKTEYELMAVFDDIATTFAIDPYDRIWVMHGTNNVSVFDSTSSPMSDPIFRFDSGPNVSHVGKNISFVCTYERSTDIREWKCLIYYTDSQDALISPQLYIHDMSGLLVNSVNILSLFNLNLFRLLSQHQSQLQFSAKGDFTGYERKRVFNKISPYKNTPQLIFKTCLKDKIKQNFPYTHFKKYVSLNPWDWKSWQHLTLTLSNRKFNLFVNGIQTTTLDYSGQYELSYETQPTLFIGSPVGSRFGFNREIASPSALFNGKFEDIKIYDYELSQENLEMFLRASIPAQNVYWSLPTPLLQYIEKVERMFKNKIPGAKSPEFNLKLKGTGITDEKTRLIIEEELRNIVANIKPVYADFLKVRWVD